MSNEITLSVLRANIYKIFDELVATGQTLIVNRNGQQIRIVPEKKLGRLSRLKKRKIAKGDSKDLYKHTWNWSPLDDLS